ncbi:MAG: hypothetical protein IPH20_15675 [Bacteroidales bacterium]|nr:hypothetical protein [Bacteroidales bacterium]
MKKRFGICMMALTTMMLLVVSGCKENDTEDPPTGVLEGSFDNLTTYPAPALLQFERKDGSEVTMLVYPGQVIVLSPEGSVEAINQLITGNDGTVTIQIPGAGFYLATVGPEREKDFISAMFKNPKVADAFPNAVIRVKGFEELISSPDKSIPGEKSILTDLATNGDKNSLIQTIDLNVTMGCPDGITHMQAVANVAGAGGVSVNINDVTVPESDDLKGADYCKAMKKTLEVLNYAYEHNQPVVINMSMGGKDNVEGDNYWYYRRYITMFKAIEMKTPHLLDNAVLLMSCGDVNVNETDDLEYLHGEFPDSPVWDHIFMVGSQEAPFGCGMGYANKGTANYLSAPACDVSIPGSQCPGTGNSFAVPRISGLIAETYEMLKEAGIDVKIPDISSALYIWQTQHNGQLPSVSQLFNLFAGGEPEVNYAGTWSGTFYYKAEIPQQSGPPLVVNTSFILTMTLEATAAVPGYPHLMKITAVTCSDPSFGATMAVAPDPTLSMAFLPAAYGSASDLGMGITVKFPNGSMIFTSNSPAGAYTIDAEGNKLESTSLVTNDAFSASGTVDNSNDPGSGPGGYAYNWCTFKSWSLVRL